MKAALYLMYLPLMLLLSVRSGEASPNATLYATCRMRPDSRLAPGLPRVFGLVLFEQSGQEGALTVSFRLRGLPRSPTQLRALHVHRYGDLAEGCASTGGHYDPSGVDHPGHPGDFGNFLAPEGKIRGSLGSRATLYGASTVLGRAVVLHEGEDDLGMGRDAGSLLHGNAGARLACCVIGVSGPTQWNKYHN